VVDAAHGAAYHVAPDVFHELGADVIAIGCQPDGININQEVGATAPAALVERGAPSAPTSASRSTVMPTGC
jgi:phosphoglucosamine mutase